MKISKDAGDFLKNKTGLFLEARDKLGLNSVGYGSMPAAHYDFESIPHAGMHVRQENGKRYMSVQTNPFDIAWYDLGGLVEEGTAAVYAEPALVQKTDITHIISCYIPRHIFLSGSDKRVLHQRVGELKKMVYGRYVAAGMENVSDNVSVVTCKFEPSGLPEKRKKILREELGAYEDFMYGPSPVLMNMPDDVFEGGLALALANIAQKSGEREWPEILINTGYGESAMRCLNYMKRELWEQVKRDGVPELLDDTAERAIRERFAGMDNVRVFEIDGRKQLLKAVGNIAHTGEVLESWLYPADV